MPSFILDIDGTLMPSHAVDNRCYWEAVSEVFGIAVDTLDLRQFEHATDGGILAEWADNALGRPPTGSELRTLHARFLERLTSAAAQTPAAFAPTSGLQRWLDAVRARGHSLAIATGGWPHTARFKLRTAGLGEDWVLASADNGLARTDIMRAAQRRLGNPPDRDITYVGDGPWDATAAATLGWAFIGIAQGRRAEQLYSAGAERVYADFTQLMVE